VCAGSEYVIEQADDLWSRIAKLIIDSVVRGDVIGPRPIFLLVGGGHICSLHNVRI
jgi:hypothetical protein